MLESENQQDAFRAVSVYLDRALGKAALQGSRQDVSRSEAVEIVRQEFAQKRDAEIPAARAMVARLIERRARELANGAEDTGRLLRTDLSSRRSCATIGVAGGGRAAQQPPPLPNCPALVSPGPHAADHDF